MPIATINLSSQYGLVFHIRQHRQRHLFARYGGGRRLRHILLFLHPFYAIAATLLERMGIKYRFGSRLSTGIWWIAYLGIAAFTIYSLVPIDFLSANPVVNVVSNSLFCAGILIPNYVFWVMWCDDPFAIRDDDSSGEGLAQAS